MFKSVHETLVCDHSNESYRAVLSCGIVYLLFKVVLTFESVDETLVCDHSNESYGVVLSCGAKFCKVIFENFYSIFNFQILPS